MYVNFSDTIEENQAHVDDMCCTYSSSSCLPKNAHSAPRITSSLIALHLEVNGYMAKDCINSVEFQITVVAGTVVYASQQVEKGQECQHPGKGV